MESSDQRSFYEPIKGSRWFWAISTDFALSLIPRRCGYIFILWTPIKSRDQEPWNGAIKRSKTSFSSHDSWSWSQTLLQVMRMWLPWVSRPFLCMQIMACKTAFWVSWIQRCPHF